MTIITAPHPTLRTRAIEVTHVTPDVTVFIEGLNQTLVAASKRGVGLAAPQVDKKLRIFSTLLPENPNADDEAPKKIRTFINPVIIDHSPKLIISQDEDSTPLEGCLSIPGFYGPVPRYLDVILEYQDIEDGRLVTHRQDFTEFAARVVQHELDHLNGILFTDYVLDYDLPIYRENPKNGKLIELDDRSFMEIL